MEDTPDQPSVDDLVARLKAKVDERERHGHYPPALVEDLEQHFHRVTAHRSSLDRDALRRAVEALDRLAPLSPERIVLESGTAGGQALHRLVARLVARQTQGVLEQVQEFADGVRQVLRLMVEAQESPDAHFHADLVDQIDALVEQVATFERGPGGADAAVADLRRRVASLEAAERDRGFRPFFSTARMEDALRGDREQAVTAYAMQAKRFLDRDPVLDVASGRGELLEALVRAGVEARGVEADVALAEECRGGRLPVEQGDPLEVVRGLPDGSLGGASLADVERLTPQQVIDLVAVAADKLRPGGLLLVYAHNPQAELPDPRRRHLVHAEYLAFVVREAGFAEVEIESGTTHYTLAAIR